VLAEGLEAHVPPVEDESGVHGRQFGAPLHHRTGRRTILLD
jgi:hypothetical protein